MIMIVCTYEYYIHVATQCQMSWGWHRCSAGAGRVFARIFPPYDTIIKYCRLICWDYTLVRSIIYVKGL